MDGDHLSSGDVDKQCCAVNRSRDEKVVSEMAVNARHFATVARLAGGKSEYVRSRLEVQQLNGAIGVTDARSFT